MHGDSFYPVLFAAGIEQRLTLAAHRLGVFRNQPSTDYGPSLPQKGRAVASAKIVGTFTRLNVGREAGRAEWREERKADPSPPSAKGAAGFGMTSLRK